MGIKKIATLHNGAQGVKGDKGDTGDTTFINVEEEVLIASNAVVTEELLELV